jgi:hypothetical protein
MPGRPCIKRIGPPLPEAPCVNLREVILQPVITSEEARFQALMDAHHYLGALPKIGHTLWYVATWQGQWLALLSFSAAAWRMRGYKAISLWAQDLSQPARARFRCRYRERRYLVPSRTVFREVLKDSRRRSRGRPATAG